MTREVLTPAVNACIDRNTARQVANGQTIEPEKRSKAKTGGLGPPVMAVNGETWTELGNARGAEDHPERTGNGADKAKPNGADTELPEGVRLKDFVAYMPMHSYIFTLAREMWPAASPHYAAL
jgi:hypothetical protein